MNKIIDKIKKMFLKTFPTVVGTGVMMGMSTVNTYASGSVDTSSVTAPLTRLLQVFEAVIAGIGAIILLKNIVEAVQAYQQQDSSGMYSALKGVVAGAIMCAAGVVLAIIQPSLSG